MGREELSRSLTGADPFLNETLPVLSVYRDEGSL